MQNKFVELQQTMHLFSKIMALLMHRMQMNALINIYVLVNYDFV